MGDIHQRFKESNALGTAINSMIKDTFEKSDVLDTRDVIVILATIAAQATAIMVQAGFFTRLEARDYLEGLIRSSFESQMRKAHEITDYEEKKNAFRHR